MRTAHAIDARNTAAPECKASPSVEFGGTYALTITWIISGAAYTTASGNTYW